MDELDKTKTTLKELLKDHSVVDKYNIFFLDIIKNEKDIERDLGDRTMQLTELYDEVDDHEEYYEKIILFKYVAMTIMMYLFYSAVENGITGISFLFMSTKTIDNLKKEIINEKFIPEKYSVNDVVFDEILLTSWDINGRTPRFFSKWSTNH